MRRTEASIPVVARQPILNREQQVFAYELLLRDGVENFFRAKNADAAARSTLDSSLRMGFDVLCNGHKAFINCTRKLLLEDGITLLPAQHTVVEVLENIAPDDLVLALVNGCVAPDIASRSTTLWPAIRAKRWLAR